MRSSLQLLLLDSILLLFPIPYTHRSLPYIGGNIYVIFEKKGGLNFAQYEMINQAGDDRRQLQ